MAVTPQIITIKEYIRETVLPRIDGTGDYNNTLVTISRNYIDIDEMQVNEFPAALVLDDGRSEYIPLTGNEFTQGRSRDDVTDGDLIQIVGYVKVDNPGDLTFTGALDDAMDKLISDIMIAWYADERLGGNVNAGTALRAKDKNRAHFDIQVGEIAVWFSLKYDISPKNSIT